MPDPYGNPTWEEINALPLSDQQKQQVWSQAAAASSQAAIVPPAAPPSPVAPPPTAAGADTGASEMANSVWAQQQSALKPPAPPGAPQGPSGAPPKGVGFQPPAGPKPPPEGDPIEAAMTRVMTADPNVSPQDMEIYDRMMKLRAAGAGAGGVSSTSTTNQSSQRLLSPEAKASLLEEKAIAGRMAGREAEQGKVRAAAADQEAIASTAKAEQLQKLAVDQSQAQAANAERMERMQGDTVKAQADYIKQAQSLDPNRFMHNKGWMGALASALGTFGAAATKNPNYIQQIISQGVERDIDAQKNAIGAAKDQVSFTQQIYQNERQRFTDKNAALEATKASMLGVMAAQQEARSAKSKGTEQEFNGQQSADQLNAAAQAKWTNALEMEAKTTGNQTTVTQQVGGAGATAGAGTFKTAAETIKERKEAQAKANPGDSEKEQTLYNEAMGRIPDDAAAALAAERLKTANNDSNWLTRTFPELSALVGATSGLTQKVAKTQASERNIKSITGAVATPAQTQAQNESVSTGWTADQNNMGVGQMQQGLIDSVGTRLMGLSPIQRAKAFERMQSAKMPPQVIEAIRTFTASKTNAEAGAELGLSSR